MQSRLEQHAHEMQQQADQFGLTLEGYRQSLRHVQLTGSLALHQVVGAFSAAPRSLCLHRRMRRCCWLTMPASRMQQMPCGPAASGSPICKYARILTCIKEDDALACAWRAPRPDSDAAHGA